jgi:hypothetical protein
MPGELMTYCLDSSSSLRFGWRLSLGRLRCDTALHSILRSETNSIGSYPSCTYPALGFVSLMFGAFCGLLDPTMLRCRGTIRHWLRGHLCD